MDTLGKKFGFKGIFWVAILVFFTVNLSYNVLVVNGDEIMEPVVGKLDNPLAYSIINHGIYEEGEMEDEAWTMVQTKGTQFVVNGQPFYVNGFNTYWLMEFAVDQSTRGKVNEVFQQASSVGLTVCRTWAFNDGQGQALQKSPSVYDEEVFKTVFNRVNTLTNITYKDDPTIFSWELMNEPRCDADPSGDKIQAWIEEMAVYAKSIDPKHLLEIGLEGFYGPSTPNRVQYNPSKYAQLIGTDFIRNHQVLGVDFASAHIYADAWISHTISDSHIPFVKSWMQAHIEDAENALNIPVVFGEFGVSAKDRGYNSSFRDAFIGAVYDTLINSTKKGGSGGGSLLWQLFPEGTDSMDDGYAIVLSKSPSTSNIISLQSTRLETFNSLCSWKCHWDCKKKHPSETVLFHDEL
ncbi:mannan endo-1,4-beta-mannosidase 6-like isoform X1 [Rhododendron vialii]|uniref:mannan endo-1,4-beta-mannosidase 6-like isoform X1 n=1 Tax=Rhododendron vialii TaxID=182163 RepID=UPI00265DA1C9|nr:mannan endo-1,4-beta-mannosidase 6-like isoform X1 [Rhododendron vialii]